LVDGPRVKAQFRFPSIAVPNHWFTDPAGLRAAGDCRGSCPIQTIDIWKGER
jgi:hypothetical protein